PTPPVSRRVALAAAARAPSHPVQAPVPRPLGGLGGAQYVSLLPKGEVVGSPPSPPSRVRSPGVRAPAAAEQDAADPVRERVGPPVRIPPGPADHDQAVVFEVLLPVLLPV